MKHIKEIMLFLMAFSVTTSLALAQDIGSPSPEALICQV